MSFSLNKVLETLSALSVDDMNDICDKRDSPSFEEGWSNIFEQLGNQTLEYHPGQKENFISISNLTQQHEITAYISDDLDLIYCAEKLGITTPFLERMKASYEKGEIPH